MIDKFGYEERSSITADGEKSVPWKGTQDVRRWVIRVKGTMGGSPAGTPTLDRLITAFDAIRLRDGDEDPVVEFDGAHIDDVIAALTAVTKRGKYDYDAASTPATQSSHITETAVTATVGGEFVIVLETPQYCSKWKNPVWEFSWRADILTRWGHTTDPDDFSFEFDIMADVGDIDEAIGLQVEEQESKATHIISFPENMATKCVTFAHSASYAGTVTEFRVKNEKGDKLIEFRSQTMQDAAQKVYLGTQAAITPRRAGTLASPTNGKTNMAAEFVSDISQDKNTLKVLTGEAQLKLSSADNPYVYFVGVTHVATKEKVVDPSDAIRAQQTGQLTAQLTSITPEGQARSTSQSTTLAQSLTVKDSTGAPTGLTGNPAVQPRIAVAPRSRPTSR